MTYVKVQIEFIQSSHYMSLIIESEGWKRPLENSFSNPFNLVEEENSRQTSAQSHTVVIGC